MSSHLVVETAIELDNGNNVAKKNASEIAAASIDRAQKLSPTKDAGNRPAG